jgi:hypothetical protein
MHAPVRKCVIGSKVLQSFDADSRTQFLGQALAGSAVRAFNAFMPKCTLSNPADKQQIIARLKTIQATSPRQWGKMTAAQMLCHLADSFRVTIGEKHWQLARVRVTPIPVPLWFLRWVALDLPMQWPQGTPTRPEVDAEADGTKPGDFENDRQELLRLLDRFTRQPRDFEWDPHPIFGPLSETEWMRWGYLHMDHHFRQFGA